MAVVHVVQHARPGPEPDDEASVKFIGVYSSRELAEQAIERLKRQPGFADWPDEFNVDSYTLDEDHWTEGFFTA